jgi:hypothetical protein
MRKSAFGIVVAIIAALAFTNPAHAEGGKGGGPRVDSGLAFTLDNGYPSTTSQYYTDKGPIDCPRCGKAVVKTNASGQVDSVHFKLTKNEKVVTAFYNYAAFDGSGVYTGASNWSGLTTLPGHKTVTDENGVVHIVYLTTANVLVRERKNPFPARKSLPGSGTANTGV